MSRARCNFKQGLPALAAGPSLLPGACCLAQQLSHLIASPSPPSAVAAEKHKQRSIKIEYRIIGADMQLAQIGMLLLEIRTMEILSV